MMSKNTVGPEELPSFGFSSNWQDPEQVDAFMRNIVSVADGGVVVSLGQLRGSPQSDDDHDDSGRNLEPAARNLFPNGLFATNDNDPQPSTSGEAQVVIEDQDQIMCLEEEQNMDHECSDISECPDFLLDQDDQDEYQDMKQGILPELKVVPKKYQRFRYQSERPDKKKPRHYEMEEDKRLLAEVKIENYGGKARIIIFCVNEAGEMHPFYLYGDNCTKGVYAEELTFGSSKVNRITRVSITTPKQKEYEDKLYEHHRYLDEKILSGIDGLQVEKVNLNKGIDNKHVVHLRVIAILGDGKVLETTTSSVQNKKAGEEFRIHRITPCSGPCNPPDSDSSVISIIVTEKTALPSDIGVVIRVKTKDGKKDWEKTLDRNCLTVIKKAVVEFHLPCYKNPNNIDDVQAEISLIDLKETMETEPCLFTYIGSAAEDGGLASKRKKPRMSQPLIQVCKEDHGGVDKERLKLAAKRRNELAKKQGNEMAPVMATGDGSSYGIFTEPRADMTTVSTIVTSSCTYTTSKAPLTSSTQQSQIWDNQSSLSAEQLDSTILKFLQNQELNQVHQQQQPLKQQQHHQVQQQQQLLQQLQQQQPQPAAGSYDDSAQNVGLSFQIAIIDGKICLVRDDTLDPNVMNICGQEVVVQAVPQQQPSDGGSGSHAGVSETANNSSTQQHFQLLQQQGLSATTPRHETAEVCLPILQTIDKVVDSQKQDSINDQYLDMIKQSADEIIASEKKQLEQQQKQQQQQQEQQRQQQELQRRQQEQQRLQELQRQQQEQQRLQELQRQQQEQQRQLQERQRQQQEQQQQQPNEIIHQLQQDPQLLQRFMQLLQQKNQQPQLPQLDDLQNQPQQQQLQQQQVYELSTDDLDDNDLEEDGIPSGDNQVEVDGNMTIPTTVSALTSTSLDHDYLSGSNVRLCREPQAGNWGFHYQ